MHKLNRVPMSWMFAGFCLSLMVFAGCNATTERKEQPASAPEYGRVGNIVLVRDMNQAGGDKVIVATYEFHAGRVDPGQAVVAFGSGREPRSDGNEFRLALVDPQGRVLSEYGIWDPRKAVVEHQGVVENPRATYVARFPFNANAREIRVMDAQGNVLATTEVFSVMKQFCARLEGDKECAATRGRGK